MYRVCRKEVARWGTPEYHGIQRSYRAWLSGTCPADIGSTVMVVLVPILLEEWDRSEVKLIKILKSTAQKPFHRTDL